MNDYQSFKGLAVIKITDLLREKTMRKTKVINLTPDLILTVQELTVAEVRDWISTVENKAEPDLVAELLTDDISLSDLPRFCAITPEQVDSLTQSELTALLATCKELNPHFFALRAKIMRFLPTS